MKTLKILQIVEDIKVVGLMLHTSFQGGRNKTEIPPFFHQVLKEGKLANVPHRLNQNQLCIFKMDRNSPDLDYIMGVEVEQVEELPAGMESITLPHGEYVVVTIIKRGPEDVGRGLGYIYEEWLPQSAYRPAEAPAFIYYDERFFSVFNQHGYAGNPVADLYVPVQTKKH